MVPTPLDAKLNAPGRALPIAISSLTPFTGNDGCTTSTSGAKPIILTGAKLVSGSYFTLLICGLIDIGLVDENNRL